MTMQVTLELPDELYELVRQWAVITHQDFAETLTNALSLVLTPMHTVVECDQPVSSLSDDDVLAQAAMSMESSQGHRLSDLLAKQQEGTLTQSEQPELLALMQLYQQLWIRQSEVLAEAVKRGLRPPLAP